MSSVSPKKLKDMLSKNEVLLVDVREEAEYKEEHIEGAVLVPLSSFGKEKLPQFEDKKLVIYCKGGVRGGKACDMVAKMDIGAEFFNLEGGITADASNGWVCCFNFYTFRCFRKSAISCFASIFWCRLAFCGVDRFLRNDENSCYNALE